MRNRYLDGCKGRGSRRQAGSGVHQNGAGVQRRKALSSTCAPRMWTTLRTASNVMTQGGGECSFAIDPGKEGGCQGTSSMSQGKDCSIASLHACTLCMLYICCLYVASAQ